MNLINTIFEALESNLLAKYIASTDNFNQVSAFSRTWNNCAAKLFNYADGDAKASSLNTKTVLHNFKVKLELSFTQNN